MAKRLRMSVLVLLVMVCSGLTWYTFAGRNRSHYGHRAEQAMIAGDWPEAEKNLLRLLDVDPDNDEGRWFLSVVYLRKGQAAEQPLEEVPETPESLALLQQLNQRSPSIRITARLVRHYVRTGDRQQALASLPLMYRDRQYRNEATTLASILLSGATGPEDSDQILEILAQNMSPTSFIQIRMRLGSYVSTGRWEKVDQCIVETLSRLTAASPGALPRPGAQNQRLLSEILRASLMYSPDRTVADHRLIQALQVLKRFSHSQPDVEAADPSEIAEIAIGLAATMDRKFPLPPLGVGGERTRRRLSDDRKLRRAAARRILEFGLPPVESGEASAAVYEYVARAAMEVDDDSRKVAILRRGLELYGDLPSDLQTSVLKVHRDSALQKIAEGQLNPTDLSQYLRSPAAKPLGHLIAGYIALEHGRLDAAQRGVDQAGSDGALATPAALLQSRIHLAAAQWQSALDVLVPLEQGWEDLTSAERVWMTKTQGGRDELRLLIAYSHVQLKQYDVAEPLLAMLETGRYRSRARVLRLTGLVRRDRWDEARMLTAVAQRADPENLALLLAEFAMLVRENQTEQAMAFLYQYHVRFPGELRLRIVLARWFEVNGHLEQALALLAQTAEHFPDDQVGLLISAEILQKLNREREFDSVLQSLNRPLLASAIVLLSAVSELRAAELDEAADTLLELAPGLPSADGYSLAAGIQALARGDAARTIELLVPTLGIPQPLRRGQNGFLLKLEQQIRDVSQEQLPARIDNLLETYPDEPVLLLASARLASRRGDTEAALSRLSTLQNVDTVPGRVDWLRARFLHQAGRIDQSREAVVDSLRQAPLNNAARLLAAQLAWQQKDYESTLRQLDMAGFAGEATTDLLDMRADSLLQLGRQTEAEPVYIRVLQHDPQRIEAWLAVVLIQSSGGRYAEAIATIESGLNALPGESRLQTQYLELLGQTRQLTKLEEVVRHLPGLRMTLDRCLRICEIYLESGDLFAAQRWLYRAREEAPYSAPGRLVFNEARVLHDNGRLTGRLSWFIRAREKYQRLLERDPDHVEGFHRYGWLLLRRFDAAKEAGSLAIRLLETVSPGNLPAEVLDTLAESLRQSSHTQQALQVVTSGLERFPESGALHFQHAALLLELSGGDEEREAQAFAALKQVQRFGVPSHHQAEFAELLLQSQ